ncbi:MAG: hypothetical protein NTW87_31775 [Planctomycetota bacterium]|nr:hypothetical protein [Planctomycetota bacterium]
MKSTPTVFLLTCCLLPCLFAVASETIPEPAPRPPAATLPPDPVEANIKAGRELFQKRQYAAAFEKFTLALAIKPKHRDARFLAGLAAYWARRPDEALEFWNRLLDTAVRNSDEEWLLETHRVQALYALNQVEAAEQVVARIYELRSKAPAGRKARGFVREHVYVGNSRLGCWEAFDEKGEVQDQWSLPVTALKLPDEPVVARLYVTAAPLPAGGNGFVFAEEGLDYNRIYRRWNQRPEYGEVRALLTQVCQGKLAPLEELRVDNSAKFPAAKEARPAQPPPAAPAATGDTTPARTFWSWPRACIALSSM